MGVLEKYYKSGLEEGRQEGRQEGWQEGRQEGRQEGIAYAQKALIRTVRLKFGVVPEDIIQRIKDMTDLIAMESLGETVIDSDSLDEFRRQLP